jgi:hypothetical protein
MQPAYSRFRLLMFSKIFLTHRPPVYMNWRIMIELFFVGMNTHLGR